MADEPLVPTQEDRDADELYNIVYHHCVTKYDPEAGKRVAASYLARHARSARLQGREEARGLVFESLYHLRVDDRAADYHKRAEAFLAAVPSRVVDDVEGRAKALLAEACGIPVTSRDTIALEDRDQVFTGEALTAIAKALSIQGGGS